MSESTNFASGAVRSADTNHLDFTSLPLVGLIGVARTAAEGGAKYGRYNYMQGMPAHDCLNHAMRHITMWLLGDRSEPHLSHAAWNVMAADQSAILSPEINNKHLLDPGAMMSFEVREELDANKDDLAARRKAGEFADSGRWNLEDLPEVRTLIDQRVRMNIEEFDRELYRIVRLYDAPEHPKKDEPAKVIYISGPMSGHENFNFPAFNAAADELRKLGYSVINPADFGADPKLTWKDCLARDLAVLGHCDVIVTLPGHEKSKGALLEVHVVRELGLPIVPYADLIAAHDEVDRWATTGDDNIPG